MKIFRRPPGTARSLGQSMVEFALILPVLLAVLFGIIEFARLFAAWLSIQNAARFGVRYAVTGRFNPQYCDDAMAFYSNHDRNYRPVTPGTGFISASEDTAIDPITGRPDLANDCNIPRGVSEHDLKTELLQDYARLRSIWDETRAGALVINADYDASVSGDYAAYLNNPAFYWDPPEGNTFSASEPHRGRPDRTGFFNVRICSYPRDNSVGLDQTYGPYFVTGFSGNPTYRYPDPCAIIVQRAPTLRYAFRDHPGGPGERVQVLVTYRHPLIMPILSSIVPNVPLTAQREGIVESFRKSKDVVLAGGQAGIIPTNTPTPLPTNTPTATATATATATPFPCAGNGATFERWNGISGTSVNDLRSHPAYPFEPASRSTLSTFRAGSNIGSDFGAVVRAVLCVPQTGNYRFWIASDDNSELLLYTTPLSGPNAPVSGIADSAMTRLAYVDSYTNELQWNRYSDQRQRSNPVFLVAGNYYYIKAIYKEGGGGDHLAVSWKHESAASPDSLSDGSTAFIIPQANLYQITDLFTNPCPAGTGATYEMWQNISGSNLSALTGNARYPNNPDLRWTIPNFEADDDLANDFGARVRAFLCIPLTGQYQFWLASDDDGQLRISGQIAPLGTPPTSLTVPGGSLTTIASVSGWTNWREWNKYGSQQSTVLNLNAGFYYLEAIYKEGGGGDNLSVAWKRPGNTFSIPPNNSAANAYIVPQAYLYIISNLPTSVPTATFTPVPTNTPAPTNTPTRTNTPGPSPTPRPTNTRTNTPVPTTPGPTNTPRPTNTPTRTNTPGPSATPLPTNTPRPPTATFTPAPTNTPPIPCPYTWPLSETYCTGGYLNPGVPTPRP